jgi:hypothetical protein
MEAWPTQEFKDAVERENNLRDAAFLNLPTSIQGRLILPMSLRHWVILNGIDSPLLWGGVPGLEQLVQFLWVLNPKFKAGRSFSRGRFIASCRSLLYGQAVLECRKYADETFMDSPPSKEGRDVPSYSFAASVIYCLASEYRMSKEEALNTPLRQTFQLMKIVRMRNEEANGESPRAWNVLSDKVKREYVRQARENQAKSLSRQ